MVIKGMRCAPRTAGVKIRPFGSTVKPMGCSLSLSYVPNAIQATKSMQAEIKFISRGHYLNNEVTKREGSPERSANSSVRQCVLIVILFNYIRKSSSQKKNNIQSF